MNQSIAIALFLWLGASACTSFEYDDPSKPETVSIDWGSTDLQSLSADMVQSLMTSVSLTEVAPSDGARTVLTFGGINNRTSEHIDTGGIADKIKVAVLQSGKYRWVAGKQGQDEIGDQVRFQQGEGRVDPAQAKAFGKQVGADVVIYGNLRSIEKERGRNLEDGLKKTDDVYYQFVLEAVSIETGEILWANEKELRKSKKTGIFGK